MTYCVAMSLDAEWSIHNQGGEGLPRAFAEPPNPPNRQW